MLNGSSSLPGPVVVWTVGATVELVGGAPTVEPWHSVFIKVALGGLEVVMGTGLMPCPYCLYCLC